MRGRRKVREFYDHLARVYDDLYGEEQEKKYGIVIQALKDYKGTMLDLGCGTGELSLLMEKARWDVIGADISIKMLEVSRGKGLENLVQCSSDELPFRSGSFNSITAITLFSNSDELLKAVNRLKELLKPNGILIASVPQGGCKSDKLVKYEGIKDAFLFLS